VVGINTATVFWSVTQCCLALTFGHFRGMFGHIQEFFRGGGLCQDS
jgi:hypothetical protein